LGGLAQEQIHQNGFKPKPTFHQLNPRKWYTRFDLGWAFQILNTDANYTSSVSAPAALTLGVMEEIPLLKHSHLLVGLEWVKENITFDSYYFAPGLSPVFNGQFNYQHDISMDELQFPLEYKFPFTYNPMKVKSFYATFGVIYRLLIDRTATIYNANNGDFIFEGENDITYRYHIFGNTGSEILELGLGYQHNSVKTGRGYFLELQYKYGVSPFNYTVNNYGTFNMDFTINTISLKFGIRY
jgi:hypothetical protein